MKKINAILYTILLVYFGLTIKDSKNAIELILKVIFFIDTLYITYRYLESEGNK
jgi:hypothetical protein